MADKKHSPYNTSDNISVAIEELTGKLPYTMTNDYLFKAFFQKNEPALRGLLCALLSLHPEDISSVKITNPIQIGESINDKTVILDIKLLLNNQQLINLEMQVRNLLDWPERSLAYLCRMFDHLHKGEDYNKVKPSLHISILDFTPEGFPESLFLKYYLYSIDNLTYPPTIHKYSDKFGIYMLQLNQLENTDDMQSMPELYYWAQFFKATTWEEIKMLAEKNETIKQGIVTLKELTADEKAKMQMEAREKYYRDLHAIIGYEKKQVEKQMGERMAKEIQQKDLEIQSLQNALRQSAEENAKLQERLRHIEERLDKIKP